MRKENEDGQRVSRKGCYGSGSDEEKRMGGFDMKRQLDVRLRARVPGSGIRTRFE